MILDGIAGIQFIFKENLFILQLFYRLIISFTLCYQRLKKRGDFNHRHTMVLKVLFTNIMLKLARFLLNDFNTK
jgi:hypothetical protein